MEHLWMKPLMQGQTKRRAESKHATLTYQKLKVVLPRAQIKVNVNYVVLWKRTCANAGVYVGLPQAVILYPVQTTRTL